MITGASTAGEETNGLFDAQTAYSTKVEYARFALLTSYETKTQKPVWETEMRSNGRNDDLRTGFPVLIAAGSAYFGRSSGKTVRLTLAFDDPLMLHIRGSKG